MGGGVVEGGAWRTHAGMSWPGLCALWLPSTQHSPAECKIRNVRCSTTKQALLASCLVCPQCSDWHGLPLAIPCPLPSHAHTNLLTPNPPPAHPSHPPVYDCVEYSKSESGPPGQYTQMLPVVAMWGQRWGLDMTATTAMPLAVRTGLARSLGGRGGGKGSVGWLWCGSEL